MINEQLAKDLGISPADRDDLIALHTTMFMLVKYYQNNRDKFDRPEEDKLSPAGTAVIKMIHKNRRKRLKKTIRHLEYMMQDKWGFPRDKAMHTHRRRFTDL